MRIFLSAFFIFVLVAVSAQNVEVDSAIRRIEKISSSKIRATAYARATEIAWETGRYADALLYSDRGLKIAHANNFKAIEANLHNNRGIAYDYLNQYPSALKHYFEALTIQEKLNDPEMEASILGNIGLIYMYQRQNSKSLYYHKRALKLNQSTKNKHGISAALNNIAISYTQQGKFEKAEYYYLQCIKIDLEAKDTVGLGDDYNNIGIVCIDLKKFDLSEKYLEEALKIRKSQNNHSGMAETYSNFGTLYMKKKQYNKAKEYFALTAELALSVRDNESLKYCYKMLTQNDIALNDSAAAFQHYQLYIAYRDSIDNSTIARKQTELELNYKFNKEKEVSRLREQEKDRLFSIILIAVSSGLVLILLFSILFFRKWKQTQRQRGIIEEKNALVQQKNDEIMASIAYAKRIQKAILPADSVLKSAFPNHIVIYLPKDIVSGDFYWSDTIGNTTFLAAADCTGHGVPGALMSVVCHNALNRTVREFNLTRPSEILDKCREIIIKELSQHDDYVADGMDISLAVFDASMQKLNWAGANNPLWIYRAATSEIEEWKANKQPIGNHRLSEPFTEHSIEVNKKDRIFLFSDGFQDQFGGKNGKKLMSRGFKQAILDSSHLPIGEQQAFLLETFANWKGNLEQIDDVCVLCAEI